MFKLVLTLTSELNANSDHYPLLLIHIIEHLTLTLALAKDLNPSHQHRDHPSITLK